MSDILTTQELITGLLKLGGTPDVDQLFELIVDEAPKLVGALECSIFWKNGPWRDFLESKNLEPGHPNAFYRRATYDAQKELIGVTFYLPGEGLTGWVAKYGKPLRIKNIKNKEELNAKAVDLKNIDKEGGYKNSTEQEKQQAFLGVPIIIESEVLGVIRIAKTLKAFGQFSEDDQKFLETFARHVAVIIQRFEVARQKKLWDDLYHSGLSLDRTLFSSYLQRLANDIPKNLGAASCSIFLTEYDFGEIELKLRATTTGGPLYEKVGLSTYGFGEGLTGWVAKHNCSLRINNIHDQGELRKISSDLKHIGLHEEYKFEKSSFLAAPVSLGHKVLGVLRVAQNAEGRIFSASDQRFVEYFCKNLSVLIQNVYLFEELQSERNRIGDRLKDNQKKLRELGKLLNEDVTKIKRSIKEITPFTDEEKTTSLGPIFLRKKKIKERMVFVGIPYLSSYKNLYNFAIDPALKELDMQPWYWENQKGSLAILAKIMEGVQQSKYGIIDVSEWNPNVLFELGLLYGQNRKVILLKREDAQLPADLQGLEFIPYGDYNKLKEELVLHLKDIIS